MTRPPAIVRWHAVEDAEPLVYQGRPEPMALRAQFSRLFGFQRLGIHHVRLLPGRRTSLPHAESLEDEFVYVLEGTPDVWLDGHLYRLGPDDAVGFPAGTGLAHSFLNNSEAEVRLLVIGDRTMAENRILYPVDPDRKPLRQDWWHDAPSRPLGPHDGRTEAGRASAVKEA